MTSRVNASGVAAVGRREAHQHLVQHDVVEDLDAFRRAQPLGHAAGEPAAALDHLAHAVAPQRAKRGVDDEATRPARRVQHVLPAVALVVILHQVRSPGRHRGPLGGRVANGHEPAVVADVQPLVGIGRPRVGALDAGDEVSQLRADVGPQPEGAVDVQPCVRVVGQRIGHRIGRVEGTGIHVAGLDADDGRDARGRAPRAAARRASGPARPPGCARHALPTQAQVLERGQEGGSARPRRSPPGSPARRTGRAPRRPSPPCPAPRAAPPRDRRRCPGRLRLGSRPPLSEAVRAGRASRRRRPAPQRRPPATGRGEPRSATTRRSASPRAADAGSAPPITKPKYRGPADATSPGSRTRAICSTTASGSSPSSGSGPPSWAARLAASAGAPTCRSPSPARILDAPSSAARRMARSRSSMVRRLTRPWGSGRAAARRRARPGARRRSTSRTTR